MAQRFEHYAATTEAAGSNLARAYILGVTSTETKQNKLRIFPKDDLVIEMTFYHEDVAFSFEANALISSCYVLELVASRFVAATSSSPKEKVVSSPTKSRSSDN